MATADTPALAVLAGPEPAPMRPPARDARPPLEDADRFVCLPRVPILDAHANPDPAKGRLEEADLRLLAANSNARADRGTYALLLIGHTTDDGPETRQPPLVGFARDFLVGDFAGRACLLADFYVFRDEYDTAMSYPHRSVERFRGDDPADHYIDAISLLRRAPDRELGLLTYGRSPAASARPAPDPTPNPPESAMPAPDAPTTPEPAPAAPNPETAPPVAPAPAPAAAPAAPPPLALDPAAVTALVTALVPALVQGVEGLFAARAEPEPEPAAPARHAMGPGPAAAPSATAGDPGPLRHEEDDNPFRDIVPDEDDDDEEDDDEDDDTDAAPPAADREKDRMRRESNAIRYARLEKRIKRQDEAIRQLTEQNATLVRHARDKAREQQLTQLEAEGYDLDRAEEIRRGAALDDAAWDDHLGMIRTRYRRAPLDGELIPTAEPRRPGRAPGGEPELTPEDVPQLTRYMRDNGIKDHIEGMRAYLADKHAKAAAAAAAG